MVEWSQMVRDLTLCNFTLKRHGHHPHRASTRRLFSQGGRALVYSVIWASSELIWLMLIFAGYTGSLESVVIEVSSWQLSHSLLPSQYALDDNDQLKYVRFIPPLFQLIYKIQILFYAATQKAFQMQYIFKKERNIFTFLWKLSSYT